MTVISYPGSLHNHTDLSNLRLRDSINKVDTLLAYANELGHSVLAFTDHEFVGHWKKIEDAMEKYPNIKVLRGNEIYLCRNGLNNTNFKPNTDKYYHFILIAKDLIGAKQIMELSTRAWKRSYMARGMRRVPTYYQDLFDIIASNPGHVIGSTACLGGALPTQILRGTSTDKLDIWIQQMQSIFGVEDFYLEMQPSETEEQIIVNKALLNFSNRLNIKYIITTDSHYAKKEDRLIHKAYLNANKGEREVDSFYATTYLMGTDEIRSFFPYLTDAEFSAACDAINEIKGKCENFSIQKPLKIPNLKWAEHNYIIDNEKYNYYLSQMPSLNLFLNSEYESDKELVKAIICGIEGHNDLQNPNALAEIEACLKDTWESSEVNKARWSAYFLNLQNIINVCWSAGTLVGPSRGSGGGFILLYVLGITQINPLRETTKVFRWRFLNPERASVLDIDTDIEGGRREDVLNAFRNYYGEDRVANVATFKTEKSRNAIKTAARGLGIDNETADYISNLIPADRGQIRSLHECMYGDEEKGFEPIKQFVIEMTENHKDLWEVAQKIEGLICGSGLHAGGVIFVDEPFTETTALMRAPNGTICTQFELHDAEAASLIKMDLLSVEAMDKIHACLDLICEYGYAERKETLRETYESIIGIYNLERDNPDMWKMVWEHRINALFQMEQQSGIGGIAIAKPKSVGELAVLNSVIRLMASERGAEQPLDMWARYRKNINNWINEMREYGLSHEQIDWLSHHDAITDGICESQEGLMSLIQEQLVGGNTLTFADKCRKAIAKKQGKLFDECEQFYFKNAEEKGCDMNLVHYVWDVIFKPQRGYSFCRAHTLAYSLIALQEMNLAFNFPLIFWNTACLIVDAGGIYNDNEETDDDDSNMIVEEEYYNEMEEFDESEDEAENEYSEDEDCDGYPADIKILPSGKKKKKTKTTNYGKISTAIGKIKSTGVTVALPNVNHSLYTFAPDVDNNVISFGLSGISKIGDELVKAIIDNRPYNSVADFLNKVKITKTQMINLIKAGAFDEFGDRIKIMREYIESVSDTKKRVTLQNMKMLIDFNLIPEEYDLVRRTFNFNKYIKKFVNGTYYEINNIAFNFLSNYYDIDMLVPSDVSESGFKLLMTRWDSIYKKSQDIIRPYIKNNANTLLNSINNRIINELWDKYCSGSLSKWEMDTISFYYHDHELSGINNEMYKFAKFNQLPNTPQIDTVINVKGNQIPLFKLYRIAGTVLDRDKAKKTISLLTTDGVVTVKIYGGVFAQYDKQIITHDASGKKKVLEKSLFSRGNKIIVTGIKQDEAFVAKVYSRTPWHRVEQIVSVNNDGTLTIKAERAEGDN